MSTENPKPTPAYVTFCETLKSRCEKLGLPAPNAADTETGLPQNAGYAFLRWGDAALIVPKAKGQVKTLDSHVPVPGAKAGGPGRVVCQPTPDQITDEVLVALATASKRPVARPQGKSTPAPQASTPALSDSELKLVIDSL